MINPLSLICANRKQTVTTCSHFFTTETFRAAVAPKLKTNVGLRNDGAWKATSIVLAVHAAEMEQVQFDAFCIQSVLTEYWDYRGVAATDRVL